MDITRCRRQCDACMQCLLQIAAICWPSGWPASPAVTENDASAAACTALHSVSTHRGLQASIGSMPVPRTVESRSQWVHDSRSSCCDIKQFWRKFSTFHYRIEPSSCACAYVHANTTAKADAIPVPDMCIIDIYNIESMTIYCSQSSKRSVVKVEDHSAC